MAETIFSEKAQFAQIEIRGKQIEAESHFAKSEAEEEILGV
jgi:hypothetical protein